MVCTIIFQTSLSFSPPTPAKLENKLPLKGTFSSTKGTDVVYEVAYDFFHLMEIVVFCPQVI